MSSRIGYNKGAVRASEVKKIPATEHWAIIEDDCYYSDGGYPEEGTSRCSMVVYYAFTDEKLWREEVIRLLREEPDRKDIRAMHVKPINPQVDVKIEVKF